MKILGFNIGSKNKNITPIVNVSDNEKIERIIDKNSLYDFKYSKYSPNISHGSYELDISQNNKQIKSNSNTVSVTDLQPQLYQGQNSISPWQYSIYDGGKFAGGFGPTQIFETDHWTLRNRSKQLYRENLYARGIIRRLVTNEINTGLVPELMPVESILGEAEGALNEWTDTTEARFNIWAKNPNLCDWENKRTFGALQRQTRIEALVSGDVLIVLHHSRATDLPKVQLISGELIRSPLVDGGDVPIGHRIRHGVEVNQNGRVVGFWMNNKGKSKRIPAFGSRSKRRIAWLVYGSDKLLDEIRGEPLLSVILQSLKEVDRYRDSVQRKAVIVSTLAIFVKKTQDKQSTLPMQRASKLTETITQTDSLQQTRKFNIAEHNPGLVLEELQVGEEPVGFSSQGVDLSFGEFEESILQGVAWSLEIPPEILRLSFSNNYSASQAAINEFKIYLNKRWTMESEDFCTPIHTEWLLSEVLKGKILAPGLIESWGDQELYDIFGAWTNVEWYGSIKPSTDVLKQARGSKLLVDEAWSTNTLEARKNAGTKFRQNIKILKHENKLKMEAMQPILEFQREFAKELNSNVTASRLEDLEEATDNIVEKINLAKD